MVSFGHFEIAFKAPLDEQHVLAGLGCQQCHVFSKSNFTGNSRSICEIASFIRFQFTWEIVLVSVCLWIIEVCVCPSTYCKHSLDILCLSISD